MESHVSASSTHLIGSLDFSPAKAGPYVQDRKSVQIHPGSGNYFSSNGIRMIRFTLASPVDWLCPDTVRIGFTVTNEDNGNPLQPVSVLPASLFSRLRILSNGQLVEDINLFNRWVNTLHAFVNPETQYMDAAEGFGVATEFTSSDSAFSPHDWAPEQIPAGGSRRVFMKLHSGLFSQEKWLPTMYCPITIEIELGGAEEAFAYPNVTINGSTQACSKTWNLSDVRLYADMCTLDSALQNSYAAHMSSGKHLPLAFSSFVCQTQKAEGANQTIVLARGFTRLKGIFVNWFKAADASGLKKAINFMYHPHASSVSYDQAKDNLEVQVQIGSKKFPEYPVNSLSEFYYRLRLALGAHFGDAAISVTPHEFRSRKFMVAFDMEKAATGPGGGVSFTGISTRGGELLTVDYKNFGVFSETAANDTTAKQSFVFLNYDALLNIRGDGAPEVLD